MDPIPPRLLPTQITSDYISDVSEFSLHSVLSEESEDALLQKESGMEVEDKRPDSGEVTIRMRKNDAKPQYFRADELWDDEIYACRPTETVAATEEDDYGEYVFHVPRRFDYEGKYLETLVDIKSSILKNILQTVMGSCKAVFLEEDTPAINPNIMFLYREDLKKHYKAIKTKNNTVERDRKGAAEQATHLKCLLKYISKDYESVEKTLQPLQKAGSINFDLLWTPFRAGEVIYTSTYATTGEPRAFKVDYGRYVDFDGKVFGLANIGVKIQSFKVLRCITSLLYYPIKYRNDYEDLKRYLAERGKKFVALAGTKHMVHTGLAFTKVDGEVIKVSVNSRVIVDAQTFRRINPNYVLSNIQSINSDPQLLDINCRDIETQGYCSVSNAGVLETKIGDKKNAALGSTEILHHTDGETGHQFVEEELMISSPLVLGFAFSKELWLEFTVSGIQDIQWNTNAFDSLVLPANQKSIVKARVQSHTSGVQDRQNQSIDDFIEGKGQGIVTVLHGPPGVGETLTAESIAELLKRPLYHVSVGELGTTPRQLEQELGKILTVAHNWGAVLLSDEADVFLEARTAQDPHRNALVSIFLRMLEYFQGILFLTTNRVKSFDDAFQSRIHMALKY